MDRAEPSPAGKWLRDEVHDQHLLDAGVRTSGFTFKQTPVKDRGVTEISITTGVDADYPSIIKFITLRFGLEPLPGVRQHGDIPAMKK